MQVYNSLQLKKGAKTEHNRLGSITQPLQFIPKKEKDDKNEKDDKIITIDNLPMFKYDEIIDNYTPDILKKIFEY